MINNLPNGWKKENISDVVFFQEGPGVRNTQFTEKGVKLLNVGNINDNKINLSTTKIYISEDEAYGKYSHFLVEEGDLLIACSGIVVNNFHKKIAFITKENLPLCLNTSTMRFRTLDKNKLNINFYKYFLMTNIFKNQLQRLITGSAQLNFGPSHIKKMLIPIPPLQQQEKIVKVLDLTSNLIEKQKKLLEKYDLFLKSKFIEMFGDPIINPMGWEVKKLKDLSTLIMSGNTPKGGSEVYVDKGILFFRSQNVWKNKILLDEIAYIDNETHSKMKKSSLKHKDILMTKTGRFNTENSSLGRASLFLGKDDSANINGHVYLIRLKKNMIHRFVVYILTTNEYRDYIRKICVGGIDKRQINKTHLEDFPIIFPPLELQNKFSSIVEKIEIIKEKENQKLKQLEDLHNSMMNKAFKGEIV